jgi:hypothetical protein
MTDPRNRPDDAPNVGSAPLEEDVRQLLGQEAPEDQDGAIDISEIEAPRQPTLSELDSGAVTIPDAEYAREDEPDRVLSLDEAAQGELRDGETDDPLVAIEEGLTYVPPTDPPVVTADTPDGMEIAAGTGVEGSSEPIDADHRVHEDLDEGELNARVREAIRADAATTQYADRLQIAVVGSTAILRGTVDDLDDGDLLAAAIERVDEINEVRDETDVAALG